MLWATSGLAYIALMRLFVMQVNDARAGRLVYHLDDLRTNLYAMVGAFVIALVLLTIGA
jgi:hypothetical protein